MSRSIRIGLTAGIASLVIAAIAFGQSVLPFAYPVAPNGTPVGYIPETTNTAGQTVWVPAGDAGSGPITLAGDTTGASNANTVVSLTGSAGTTSLKSNLTPSADNADSLGLPAARLLSVAVGVSGVQVYHAASSTPTTTLGDGQVTLAASGFAVDARLVRNGTNDLCIDNGSNGAAQLEVGGTGGTQVQVLSTGTIQIPGTGASGAKSASLTVGPQAVNAGASSNSGDIVVPFGAPVSPSTNEGAIVTQRGGTPTVAIGAYPGFSSLGTIWLGADATTRGTNNWSIRGGGTGTSLAIGQGAANVAFYADLYAGNVGQQLGTASNPWGNTVFGAGNSGYHSTTAIAGSHNTQDNIIQDSTFDLRTTNASFGPFNAQTYTLAAHHGVTIDCEGTGRIVTSGAGGTFWTAAADNTYGCRVAATAAYTGAAGLGNAITYLHCDCSGGACSSPSSPTNPLLVFAATINTGTGVAQVTWSTYNDGSTTKPVVDIISHCIVTDD